MGTNQRLGKWQSVKCFQLTKINRFRVSRRLNSQQLLWTKSCKIMNSNASRQFLQPK